MSAIGACAAAGGAASSSASAAPAAAPKAAARSRRGARPCGRRGAGVAGRGWAGGGPGARRRGASGAVGWGTCPPPGALGPPVRPPRGGRPGSGPRAAAAAAAARGRHRGRAGQTRESRQVAGARPLPRRPPRPPQIRARHAFPSPRHDHAAAPYPRPRAPARVPPPGAAGWRAPVQAVGPCRVPRRPPRAAGAAKAPKFLPPALTGILAAACVAGPVRGGRARARAGGGRTRATPRDRRDPWNGGCAIAGPSARLKRRAGRGARAAGHRARVTRARAPRRDQTGGGRAARQIQRRAPDREPATPLTTRAPARTRPPAPAPRPRAARAPRARPRLRSTQRPDPRRDEGRRRPPAGAGLRWAPGLRLPGLLLAGGTAGRPGGAGAEGTTKRLVRAGAGPIPEAPGAAAPRHARAASRAPRAGPPTRACAPRPAPRTARARRPQENAGCTGHPQKRYRYHAEPVKDP
jgi:hypothetical protein